MTQRKLLEEIFSSQKTSKLFIMGILNVTPDSFSDGGNFFTVESATQQALKLFKDGAAIVDIGGESTRPGSESISIQTELDRVIPVIKAIVTKSDGILSIDTVKPEVALEAIKAGAKIVNDISGLNNPEMVKLCTELKVPVIISHINGTPKTMQNNPTYNNVTNEVFGYLSSQAIMAKSKGIKQILVDPGIGFGKTLDHNIELIKNLATLTKEHPVLLGTSRKTFIGKLTQNEVSTECDLSLRDYGTIATSIFAKQAGVRVIRVHNVNANIQALKVWEALA